MVTFILVAPALQAQQVWDFYGKPEDGITVTGIVKGEIGGSGGGSIKIYRDGKFFQEIFPGGNGQYEVELPYDSEYELEFSVPGCVTKKIKVETNLPKELQSKPQDPLAFNMSLPKASLGPLDEAYQVPVSRLFFDKGFGDFNRDMVAEETFRNTLRAKQAEQKRWLEEQKAKEDAEKQKKKEEELAKKKAEEEARAAAKKKAAEEAKRKDEEDARRQAELAAQKKAQEEALKKARDEAFIKKQKEEELRKLEELRKKEEADSLYKANEKLRLEKLAAEQEAERKRKEAADQVLWEKLNSQQAAWAEKRRKEIADSTYLANERIRLEKEKAEEEAKRKRDEEANAAFAGPAAPATGGAGRAVFYQIDMPEYKRAKDYTAKERTENWLKIQSQRQEAYRDKLERRMKENENIRRLDAKKQKDFLEKRLSIEERRRLAAEKMKQKEAEAEAIRQARLKETLDKKIVILVAYSSASTHGSNMKFYGYVNFGDGKGPIELTESEYKEMALRYKGIYNKP